MAMRTKYGQNLRCRISINSLRANLTRFWNANKIKAFECIRRKYEIINTLVLCTLSQLLCANWNTCSNMILFFFGSQKSDKVLKFAEKTDF